MTASKIGRILSVITVILALVLGIVMLLACLGGLTYDCLKWTGVVG
jgi:hypothetical protein